MTKLGLDRAEEAKKVDELRLVVKTVDLAAVGGHHDEGKDIVVVETECRRCSRRWSRRPASIPG